MRTFEKLNTLIYSHDLKRDDIFFDELTKCGLQHKYVIIDSLTPEMREFQRRNPQTIFHPTYDLRRGVFPKGVEGLFLNSKTTLDQDILEFFSDHWFDLFQMCSRMDGNGFCFSFQQRWELIRNTLVRLKFILTHFNIEMVIIKHVPHFPSECILFYLCKMLHIPVIIRVDISGSLNAFFATSIKEKDLPLRMIRSKLKTDSISPENRKYFERLKSNYNEAIPPEIKKQRAQKLRDKSYFNLARAFGSRLPRLFMKLFKNTHLTMKSNTLPISNRKSGLNYLQLLWYFYKARLIISRNQSIYKSMTVDPDLTEKFILFTSSYQPERTTCPDAGYFTDQILSIEMLSKTIPDDWKIYYKEHPTCFLAPNSDHFYRGHMFRSREYFEQIKSYPNVQLVDADYDNFILIDNSIAVASATGTSSWEAAIRGKVGMIFGNSWFEGCRGVFRIRNQNDLRKVIDQIHSGYKADLNEMILFREAFLKASKHCPSANCHNMSDREFATSFATFVLESIQMLSDLNLIKLKRATMADFSIHS